MKNKKGNWKIFRNKTQQISFGTFPDIFKELFKQILRNKSPCTGFFLLDKKDNDYKSFFKT